MHRHAANALLLLVAAASAGTALARTSDRDQPMDAKSDRNSCNLGDGGQCVLTGAVRITQGSLAIDAAKAVIYRAGGDISRAVFSGGPVRLAQQLDDGTPMNAQANGVDYDLRTEVVTFTGNVRIEQPSGSLSGERVVYDLKTGNIEGRGDSNGQIHMRIVPTRKAAPASGKPADKPADKTTDKATDKSATGAAATDAPAAVTEAQDAA